jgi:mannose-6-phosphate isomerase-like protein (cupin superfamily)
MKGTMEYNSIIAAWQEYFAQHDWRQMINGHTPIRNGCGMVYDVPNLVQRADESMAIVDMSVLTFGEPHYHPIVEIYFVLQGQALVVVGTEKHYAQTGDVIVIPPYTAHYTLPYGEFVIACVNTPPFTPESYIALTQTDASVAFDYDEFMYNQIESTYPSYVCTNRYGRCLRAATDLPKGTVVATADFEPSDKPYIAGHTSNEHTHVALVSVAPDGQCTWGKVRGKWAFCNHSCDPNCDLNNDWQIVTNRDLPKGTELTTSYDSYVPNLPWRSEENFTCLCGTAACKGTINEYRMDIMYPPYFGKQL